MKVTIEIEEKEFNDSVQRAVNNYLCNNGLLGFIREEIKRISGNRRDIYRELDALKKKISKEERLKE